MDFPETMDCYIKASIEHSLGLPVNEQALNIKLKAYDELHKRLRRENLFLLSKLNEKDVLVEKAREESRMNAQALKKFVEENTNLVLECGNLLTQCSKWEKEVSLYDHDREALMDFGNEADERAKQSENRVCELEEKVKELSNELSFYKEEVVSGGKGGAEEKLLESVLMCLAPQADDDADSPPAFLTANKVVAACETLHQTWKDMKPATRRVVSLVGEVVALKADKENLRINLNRAEDEVEILFSENNILDEENKKLLIHCSRKRNSCSGSSKKQTKRKPLGGGGMVGKIEFGEMDSQRQPLSPLLHNSPRRPLQ